METIKDWERSDAATAGYIVLPGEGELVPGRADAVRKAGNRTTDGKIAVTEATLAAGEKAPRHRHRNTAEFLCVLEGEILLRIGERVATVGAGTFAFSPVGSVHGFRNLGERPARVLIGVWPPEPAERFVEAMVRLPAAAGPPEWERVGRDHGVEVVGPPMTG